MTNAATGPIAAVPDAEADAIRQAVRHLKDYLTSQIIGQDRLVERLLVALLADGHLLVEGPPGLAKTRAIKALAHALEADFQRVQFTPDLLPADLTGSDIYRPEEGIVPLPARPAVSQPDPRGRDQPRAGQGAIGAARGHGRAADQRRRGELQPAAAVPGDGDAESDRAGRHLSACPKRSSTASCCTREVDYPDRATTLKIMKLARREAITQRELPPPEHRLSQETILAARRAVLALTLSDPVAEYIAALVDATRRPDAYSTQLREWLRWGASPRAAIAMERGARALAWLDGRDFVTPEDVQAIAPDALRHRLLLDYSAQARGMTADACIEELLGKVPAP